MILGQLGPPLLLNHYFFIVDFYTMLKKYCHTLDFFGLTFPMGFFAIQFSSDVNDASNAFTLNKIYKYLNKYSTKYLYQDNRNIFLTKQVGRIKKYYRAHVIARAYYVGQFYLPKLKCTLCTQ